MNQPDIEEDCPFVPLVLRLLDYDGDDVFGKVLIPWVEANPGAAAWLASLRKRGCNVVPNLQSEDLWRLYALSRVCEMLMLSLQTAEPMARSGGHLALSMRQFEDFFPRLGIDVMRPEVYAPFHHEIVATFPAPGPDQVPQILVWHWPSSLVGARPNSGEAAAIASVSALFGALFAPCRKRRPAWGTGLARETQDFGRGSGLILRMAEHEGI